MIKLHQKQKSYQDGFRTSARQGAASEALAIAHLLRNGFEVFRNVAATGPIDLVAIKDGKTTLIDVKTTQLTKRGLAANRLSSKTPLQKQMNVTFLHVFEDGQCIEEGQVSQCKQEAPTTSEHISPTKSIIVHPSKVVYGGIKTYYPVCQTAVLFTHITRTKALAEDKLTLIKKLGYAIEVQQQSI